MNQIAKAYPARFLNLIIKSAYTTSTNSRVKTFTDYNDLKDWLKLNRPTMHCLYFRSNWNPWCEQSDKHFDEISNKFNGYEFIRVDTDAIPKAKKYFDVRCEPEFVVCAQGTEMTRQTGVSKETLEKKLNTVNDHIASCDFVGKSFVYEDFDSQWRQEYDEVDKEVDFWAR